MAILVGPDHRFQMANPGYLKLIGRQDVTGKSVQQALPDAVAQGYLDLLNSVYQSGEPFTAHGFRYDMQPDLSGPVTERYVDFVFQPLRDSAGQVSGIFVEGADVTERYLTDERLKLAIDAAQIGIFDFSPLTGELTWDARTRELFGAPLVGEVTYEGTFLAGLHPDDRAAANAAVQSALDPQGPGAFSIEYRTIALDTGIERWVAAKGKAIVLNGKTTRFVGTVRDVTQRRRAVDALSATEERYRLAAKATTDAIWDWDLLSNHVVWNEALTTAHGHELSSVEPTGDWWIEHIHPDDRQKVSDSIHAVIDGNEESWTDTYRFLQADGNYAAIVDRGYVIRAADGSAQRMIGAMLDITERDRTDRRQRALVTLGDHLRTLTDPSELAYAAAEVLGTALGVSRAGYGTVDKSAETITIDRDWNAPGIKTLAGILQFRDYGSYIEDLKRGETVVFENAELDPRTVANAAALKAISAQSVVNMPVTESGNFVALLYLNHETARRWSPEELDFVREVADRTRMGIERRRAEQELRELTSNLEQQVEQRTDELMIAEQALRQAQKMEAVGQLTGGLAHDFNNLLTGITGSLELMESRIRQGRLSELDRYISAAQNAAKRAANLTHRLLAFSRQQTLDPKPTDVNRLVNGMEELIRRTIGPEVTLEVVTAGGIWSTLVDPPQLENSLLNLCINARDAMPHGGRITIETANKWLDERAARERQLPPGQYISLCVTDSGTGMTPDVIAKAFDPFFTTKPIGQGTGLGLSMIYGFVRQTGGQVRIYSEVGQGTTMCLYLPRHSVKIDEVETQPSALSLPRAEQGQTVLIVDDEPTVRMLVMEVLEDLGYSAIEASDASSGLKVLQSDIRIDLVVSDVGLPGGMNGRQMIDAGRRVRPDLKVLFITGYAENAAVGHGYLEAGMHVMTKPFTMEVLAAKVRELIVDKQSSAVP